MPLCRRTARNPGTKIQRPRLSGPLIRVHIGAVPIQRQPGDQSRDFRDRLGCPVLQPFLQNGNTAADGKQEDIPLRIVVELGIVLKNDQIHQPHHIVLKAGVPAVRQQGQSGKAPAQAALQKLLDAYAASRAAKGTYTAAVLAAIIAAPVTYFIMGSWGPYIAILAGLVAGCAIGYFTEYYTSDTYKPTQGLADSTETGAATTIIGGISLGLKSTMSSILIVAAAVIISFISAGGYQSYNQGLYGIGIAAVGMLSTLGITLATDAYGPVADNAGGIAEMSGLPEEVRERTDALDSLGNTTAATGKGFAIGSASLTALALLVSYVSIADAKLAAAGKAAMNLSLTNPGVLVGLFIGAMLTFVFSAFTMSAVQRAAQSIVVEVRRQFKEIPGIMEYKADPDYAQCVSLCTQGALHEMVAPALLAIVVPLATGLILGPTGVVGLLGGVSVTGFAMAVFMSNAGGAWDNAKKYIEGGHHGGKGSEQHKAAVVGDDSGIAGIIAQG